MCRPLCPLTAFSLFVAFFLIHCYPLPQYVQQARAEMKNYAELEQKEQDGMKEREILAKIDTNNEAKIDDIPPCILSMPNERKYPTINEWQKMPSKATTTTERGKEDEEEGGRGVLLRPVSWQQSSTKPTVKNGRFGRMR